MNTKEKIADILWQYDNDASSVKEIAKQLKNILGELRQSGAISGEKREDFKELSIALDQNLNDFKEADRQERLGIPGADEKLKSTDYHLRRIIYDIRDMLIQKHIIDESEKQEVSKATGIEAGKVLTEIALFPSLYEAMPRIKEIVSRDKQTSIKIIAATGGTTVATILPTIISSSSAQKIEISMGILAPDTPCKDCIPRHWPQEIEITIGRAEEFKSDRVSIDLFLFEILPVPHGLLLNDEHLFLGFFSWITSTGKSYLAGAQLPHRYYHKSYQEYEYFYNLFESWFKYAPRRELKGRQKSEL